MKNKDSKLLAFAIGGYLVGATGTKVLLDPWVDLVCHHTGLSGRVCAKIVRFYLMDRAGNNVAKMFQKGYLYSCGIKKGFVTVLKNNAADTRTYTDVVHEKEEVKTDGE